MNDKSSRFEIKTAHRIYSIIQFITERELIFRDVIVVIVVSSGRRCSRGRGGRRCRGGGRSRVRCGGRDSGGRDTCGRHRRNLDSVGNTENLRCQSLIIQVKKVVVKGK